MPNRLAHEKSPYLLQHANNPIDWYAWGDDAFEKAKQEDKLVLVSIGYATCHWCHVMEHESFEDPELASYFNDHFVGIKVDREERPDVDKVYMDALHAQGQQGGWPLNMFVTPEGKPVAGGTYFPPSPKHGRPSFKQVLENLHKIWMNERHKMEKASETFTHYLQERKTQPQHKSIQWGNAFQEKTFKKFQEMFDDLHAGFAMQPENKFPPSMGLMMLLRYYHQTQDSDALMMVEQTLRKMKNGGIYDQIGGGLSRYSTDYQWLVPHFEKMLYDNALFVWAAVETFQVTNNPVYQSMAEDVLAYVERDMMSDDGGFYSAEDADSEGKEGKFYVWTPQEIHELLGADLGDLACRFWGVTEEGNFEEGTSILHCAHSEAVFAEEEGISVEELQVQLQQARNQLLEARNQRQRPLCDDKILTSWNALMISAFAKASQAFQNSHYANVAARAADFIRTKLYTPEGRLLRRFREGDAAIPGFLCDHSQLANAYIDLYESTYDTQWLEHAQSLMEQVHDKFYDSEGAYFDTAHDAEALIARPIDGYDGVEPSGNSSTALAFLRLYHYDRLEEGVERTERILTAFAPYLEQAGPSFGAMHWALDAWQSEYKNVIIVGAQNSPETQALLQEIQTGFYPHVSVTWLSPEEAEKQQKTLLNDLPTAYVCYQQSCQEPVNTVEALRTQLTSNH